MKSKGNTSFQEVHLLNPAFQSKIKGSCVTDTLHSPIHEDFDTIDDNVTMIINNDTEGGNNRK